MEVNKYDSRVSSGISDVIRYKKRGGLIMGSLKKEDILNDEDFKKLSSQRLTIALLLTVLELVLYFGFIALIAFDKSFLAQKLSAGVATTIGIPIAVGTIVFSWVFTGIYIWWANSKYDSMVNKVIEKMGG